MHIAGRFKVQNCPKTAPFEAFWGAFIASLDLLACWKWIIRPNRALHRIACLELFCQKDVLKKLAKFTGKYQWQSLFFNKVACLSLQLDLKKRLWHSCFPVNFTIFLRTLFYRTPLVVASGFRYIMSCTELFAKSMSGNITCFY